MAERVDWKTADASNQSGETPALIESAAERQIDRLGRSQAWSTLDYAARTALLVIVLVSNEPDDWQKRLRPSFFASNMALSASR